MAMASAMLWTLAQASVIILPGGAPRPYTGLAGASSMDDFYRRSAANEFTHARSDVQVLMAVYDDNAFQTENQIVPSSESFVRGAIQAWADNLHLVLRPDEVWFTILSQLFFYVNRSGNNTSSALFEPRRSNSEPMTLTDFEWFRVIQDFKYEAESRCKAPWLMMWAMPNFTTSTVVDEMTSTVYMLGQNEAFLDGVPAISSIPSQSSISSPGLPSVTLQGERDDWAEILLKLDRLPLFGPEASKYKDQLTPILRRIIASFDAPDSPETRLFWNQMATAGPSGCSHAPIDAISGWILGFFYWDASGQPLYRGREAPMSKLDNTTYPRLNISSLPIAYARAPFILRGFNNTDRFEAYVLAGTLGKQVSPGPPDGYGDALKRANQTGLNTTQSALLPLSAWMLYGPADFNATEQRWTVEPELAELASVLSNSSQCT